jgi:hypothetical protein
LVGEVGAANSTAASNIKIAKTKVVKNAEERLE